MKIIAGEKGYCLLMTHSNLMHEISEFLEEYPEANFADVINLLKEWKHFFEIFFNQNKDKILTKGGVDYKSFFLEEAIVTPRLNFEVPDDFWQICKSLFIEDGTKCRILPIKKREKNND